MSSKLLQRCERQRREKMNTSVERISFGNTDDCLLLYSPDIVKTDDEHLWDSE